jgi:hypothetical protein
MLPKIYLIVSGMLIITAMAFFVAPPDNAYAQCQKVIENYDNGQGPGARRSDARSLRRMLLYDLRY